jgi:TP901 family phage tail tape measure protein
MAGQEIAYLTAVVGADVTSFRAGMREVRQSLLDVGGLSESLRTTGRNLTLALTVPMGIAGAAALDMAVDFDAAMRNVASISDVVANNFENSSDVVLEWGSNIRSGPVAAAEALNTVMQAGFGINDFNEALLVAQISATTAEAGLADLTTTTEALVAALLSYSEGADQAAYFSDILTRMVQVGVGTMSEFGNSLAQVLPSAATLGVEFDELGGVMAYLTQRGFPASRAATSLANAFNKLITPSEEMNRVWTELGVGSGQELIDTFGGVQGAFNALFEIADKSPDAARALAAMFPDERGRRAIQLAMTDVDAFNATMNEFMADVTGATGRAHAEQMRSFAAQFDLMKAAGSELAITIGQHLMPVLLPLVVGIRDLFQSLSDTNPHVMQLGLAIAGVVAAAGPLLYILGTLITPVGLLAGAVVGLAGAFALNFGDIQTTVERFIRLIIPDFDRLRNLISTFFSTLMGESEFEGYWTEPNISNNYTMTWVEGTTRPFTERLDEAWTNLAPEIGRILNRAINEAIRFVVVIGFPAIDDLVSGIINSIANLFAGTENTYKGANSPVFQFIRNLFNGGIGEAANSLGSWFQEHFPNISEAFSTLFTNLGEWLENEGVPAFGRILGYAIGRIGSLIADLIRGIFSGTGQESPIVKGFREGFVGGLNQAFDDAGITNALDRGVTLIAGILGTLFLGAVFVGGIGKAISGAIGLAFSGIKFLAAHVFLPIAGAIISGIGTAIAGAGGIAGIAGAIGGALQNAAIWLYLYGIPGFLATATSIVSGIGTAILALPAAVGIIGAAIAGVIAGLIIFDLVPQDTRNAIAQAILDAIGLGFLEVDSAEYAAHVQAAIADPIARILDVLGVEHGLWELMDQTQADLMESAGWRLPPVDSSQYSESLRLVLLETQDYRLEINPEYQGLVDDLEGYLNTITTDHDNAAGKLYTSGNKIKADTANMANAVGTEMSKMKGYFNVQQVTLPTEPFTNALHNLRNAIQPIIDGIIAAWNAMLALIGQQVTIPTPPATGGTGGGSGGKTGGTGGSGVGRGGRVTPAFATPGFLGAGQWGLLGDNGPELVRFGRPTALMPKSMYSGESSGMTQNNNITIVTNDPDRLLEDLRRRGIDLKKRA